MLDVSLAELGLIAAVGIIFLKPEDAPQLMRSVGKGVGKVRRFWREATGKMESLIEDPETPAPKRGPARVSYILDLEGKPQQTYSLDDLEKK